MKIVLIIAVLIAYGSIYPGNFSEAAPDALAHFFSDTRWFTSLSDTLANIALFIPLGLAGGWLIFESRRKRTVSLCLLIAFALLLALSLQILQIWLPSRSAALADVLWNMAGLLVGMGAGFFAHNYLVLTPPKLVPGIEAMLPFVLLSLLLTNELFPLVPALDWQQFKDALKPLQANEFHFTEALMHSASIVICAALFSVSTRMPLLWTTLTLLFLIIGKIIVINQVLDLSTLLGLGAGYLLSVVFRFYLPGKLPHGAFWLLLFTWTAQALTPFTYQPDGYYSLVPFATMLEGSMITNAAGLVQSLFIYASLLWLVLSIGGNARGAAIALIIWSILIELIQAEFLGRTADITEPVLITLVWWGLSGLKQSRTTWRSENITKPAPASVNLTESAEKKSSSESMLFSILGTGSHTKTWLGILLIISIISLGLWTLIQLPGAPYNLRELFGKDRLLGCFVFAVVLLWLGAGPQWIVHRAGKQTWPALWLLLWLPVVACISLLMLQYAVTSESLSDITGSPDLYRRIVQENIWGDNWRDQLKNWPNAFVSTLERTVRYTALYWLLLIPLTLFALFNSHLWRPSAITGACFILLFLWWGAKWIVIDAAITDNLTELIAPDGQLYLGALLLLLAMHANLLSRANFRPLIILIITIGSVLSLVLSWWLLNQGLETVLFKYDTVFSALQFLLGANRNNILAEEALLMRWAIVYFGIISVIALGMRCTQRLTSPTLR